MSLALLLDTRSLLWWAHQPGSLSEQAYAAIADEANRIFVSPVSAMEIATKHRRNRLEFDSSLAVDFAGQVASRGFEVLPISADHAQLAGSLIGPHEDPWARLLAAQALLGRLTLVTVDRQMPGFGVETLW